MIQTFHAFPIRAAVQIGAAVAVDPVIGLRDNTTTALEIDSDFIWLMIGY